MTKEKHEIDEDGGAAGGIGDGAPTNRVGDGKGFATYSVPLFIARRNKPINEVNAETFKQFRIGKYTGDEWAALLPDEQRVKVLEEFHQTGETLIYTPELMAGVILRKKHLRNQQIDANSI